MDDPNEALWLGTHLPPRSATVRRLWRRLAMDNPNEVCRSCYYARHLHRSSAIGPLTCPTNPIFAGQPSPYRQEAPRCECGSEKCGLPIHSSWCPKAVRP